MRGKTNGVHRARPPHPWRLAPDAGFTLIELVFVMAILGILLAASIPRFARTVERLRVEQTAFELTQLLRYARERAVVQGDEIAWMWDQEAHRALLEVIRNDGTEERLTERGASTVPTDERVSVTLARDGQSLERLLFFPDGTSEAATLEVKREDASYTIRVDATTGQALLSAGTAPR